MKTVKSGSLAEVFGWEKKYGVFVGSPTGAVKRSGPEFDLGTFAPHGRVLSAGVEIKGSISTDGGMWIDGKIEGEIYSKGLLTIGENADIRGEIRTESITVFGKVQGTITVSGRCELKSKCTLQGDLRATRLIIEEGATFIGKSEIVGGLAIRVGPIDRPQIVRRESHLKRTADAVA
jgi:cytoskeletal protein CcmA (bactofilin family)